MEALSARPSAAPIRRLRLVHPVAPAIPTRVRSRAQVIDDSDELRLQRRWLWLLAAAFAMSLISIYAHPASAQDSHGVHGQGHDALHHWYETLKQPNSNVSCCNDQDCRPTVARMVDGAVQVEIDGEWTNVPPEKILKTPSPDLGTHVCAPKQTRYRGASLIFCVILGSGV